MRFCFYIISLILITTMFPQKIISSTESNLHSIWSKNNNATYIFNNFKWTNAENDISSWILIDVPKEYQAQVKMVLKSIPKKYLRSLQQVKYKPDSNRRWLASYKSIYLNFDKMDSKQEIRRVLIHELWHIFDLWYMVSKTSSKDSNFKDWSSMIYQDDKSVLFYSLCWKNEKELNWQCWDIDFVSWYAKSDPFEDFAESFLLFLENNESFKIMAGESSILREKYELLSSFLNQVPNTWVYNRQLAEERLWDLTNID